MDATFITIHDLSEDAHILYSSDSIVDILGYAPDEVVNRPVWHYFHPDEAPFAKAKHSQGVRLDKAAVLSYCRLKRRQGDWISCECCFSIVYDVMVCCTSVYRKGMRSQHRAVEAPIVRKLFASSSRDPRYDMLSHLSTRFHLNPEQQTHEPRAALFLNRFTRTLTIMYATDGIKKLIGISGEAMKGRSFYYCITSDCLEDAVRCLETAKANDSIAYLRFFFRDPRQDDPPEATASESEDEIMTSVSDSDGDVGEEMAHDAASPRSDSLTPSRAAFNQESSLDRQADSTDSSNQTSLQPSLSDEHLSTHSSSPSSFSSTRSEFSNQQIELEAVISCTSDGLVVCLRRARARVVLPGVSAMAGVPKTSNGIYAAPWAAQPILPPVPTPGRQDSPVPWTGHSPSFQNEIMQSIRDVAIFAWALVGINGNLKNCARGKPTGESQPPRELATWRKLPDPAAYRTSSVMSAVHTSASSAAAKHSSTHNPFGFGDPGR